MTQIILTCRQSGFTRIHEREPERSLFLYVLGYMGISTFSVALAIFFSVAQTAG